MSYEDDPNWAKRRDRVEDGRHDGEHHRAAHCTQRIVEAPAQEECGRWSAHQLENDLSDDDRQLTGRLPRAGRSTDRQLGRVETEETPPTSSVQIM